MKFSLRVKIIGTVSVVVALLILLGGISFWASRSLVASANNATSRLADAKDVSDGAFWAVKQYQNQADLIINQDLDIINDFQQSAQGFESALKRINEIVDTPEEKTWAKEIKAADDQYDEIFHKGIVPEVKYQLEGVLKKLDGESDVALGQMEEYAEKISESLWAEFNEAAQKSNDQELAKRARDLDVINKLLFWSKTQYQNQADLIINQDLKSIDDFKNSQAQMDKYRELLGVAVDTPEEKEWFKKIVEADKIWDELYFNKIVPAVEKELKNDLQRLDGETDTVLSIVQEKVGLLVKSLGAEANEAVSEYQKTARTLQYTIVIVAALASVLGLVLGFFIANSIAKPINKITAGMSEGANQVASASGQVSSSSQSMAEGASQQAASIEETSSSMEEMSSMTKKNAENAGQADTLMKETNKVVATANQSMDQLTQSMADISKASEETSKIIKTIDEIAFQTNLLALNAAVEAARAGEAGAGFAVVADEVRNLAMRASDAAKNTAALIEGTVKKVKDGSELVATTNNAFSQVAESSAKVGDIVSEIAEASKEQSSGIEQVNIAITEMDKVVQQNAANAEESASASEEMSAQAEQLKDYVSDLVMLVTGKKNQAGAVKTHHVIKTISSKSKSITKGKNKLLSGKTKEVRPDQVIPFDDDFKDF